MSTNNPFYCTLCSKGYSRAPDYDAHLSSYDHSHRKRMADMKVMTRDHSATQKARERENKKLGGGITIKPIKLGGEKKDAPGEGAKGFKRGGFKAFGVVGGAAATEKKENPVGGAGPTGVVESDSEEEEGNWYERYDPAKPTD